MRKKIGTIKKQNNKWSGRLLNTDVVGKEIVLQGEKFSRLCLFDSTKNEDCGEIVLREDCHFWGCFYNSFLSCLSFESPEYRELEVFVVEVVKR